MSLDEGNAPPGSFAAARAKSAGKFNAGKAARKGRHKRTADAVNIRSLNGTGRMDKFSFRCTTGLKEECHRRALEEGVSVAEWMETALQDYMERSASTEAVEEPVGE